MEEGPEGESVDGGIDDVSHIIVDEVHERSLDSDFLLMVLKDLLKVRVDLKVILMSATLNAELFASYFDGAPLVHIPGRTFPVTALYLADALARTAYKPSVEFCRKGGHGKGKQVMDDHSKSPKAFKSDALNRKDSKMFDPKFDPSPSKGRKFQKNRFTVETEISDDETFPTFDSENVRDEDLNVTALMKRYPKLKEPAASALSMMDTDKIQYPLVEMIVVEIPEAVQAAINTLCTLRALSKNETLTPLGFHLGRLPVDVRIGKLILFGSIFGCLDSVLTIASAMSVKSPFVAPFEKRFMADVKKQEFATGVSDYLTLLTAYNTWLVVRRDGFPAERAFLYDNFLSGKTLNMIASVKRQLAELLSDIEFIKTHVRAKDMERKGGRISDGVADAIGESGMRGDHSELINAVLVSALYPNVIKIESPPPKGGGMKGKGPSAQDLKLWVQNDEAVFIHPTSVNHKGGKYPTKFLVYHEKLKTSKVYIRDCSSVRLLRSHFLGEGWIQFAAGEKEAAVIEATRTAFDKLLQMKIENPELDVSTTGLVREIISLVTRNGGN
ncbi:helicase associated domain-containing protein [Chytriomyces cf. hyalinus JEL632]|nr:helicase associated domain-containing protein [Chytriomyces cf. hyalinus JEL632]